MVTMAGTSGMAKCLEAILINIQNELNLGFSIRRTVRPMAGFLGPTMERRMERAGKANG